MKQHIYNLILDNDTIIIPEHLIDFFNNINTVLLDNSFLFKKDKNKLIYSNTYNQYNKKDTLFFNMLLIDKNNINFEVEEYKSTILYKKNTSLNKILVNKNNIKIKSNEIVLNFNKEWKLDLKEDVTIVNIDLPRKTITSDYISKIDKHYILELLEYKDFNIFNRASINNIKNNLKYFYNDVSEINIFELQNLIFIDHKINKSWKRYIDLYFLLNDKDRELSPEEYKEKYNMSDSIMLFFNSYLQKTNNKKSFNILLNIHKENNNFWYYLLKNNSLSRVNIFIESLIKLNKLQQEQYILLISNFFNYKIFIFDELILKDFTNIGFVINEDILKFKLTFKFLETYYSLDNYNKEIYNIALELLPISPAIALSILNKNYLNNKEKNIIIDILNYKTIDYNAIEDLFISDLYISLNNIYKNILEKSMGLKTPLHNNIKYNINSLYLNIKNKINNDISSKLTKIEFINLILKDIFYYSDNICKMDTLDLSSRYIYMLYNNIENINNLEVDIALFKTLTNYDVYDLKYYNKEEYIDLIKNIVSINVFFEYINLKNIDINTNISKLKKLSNLFLDYKDLFYRLYTDIWYPGMKFKNKNNIKIHLAEITNINKKQLFANLVVREITKNYIIVEDIYGNIFKYKKIE